MQRDSGSKILPQPLPPCSSLCSPLHSPPSSSCWTWTLYGLGQSPTGRMSSVSHTLGTMKLGWTELSHIRTSIGHPPIGKAFGCRDASRADLQHVCPVSSTWQVLDGAAFEPWTYCVGDCGAKSVPWQWCPPRKRSSKAKSKSHSIARPPMHGCDARAWPKGGKNLLTKPKP